MKLEFAIKHAYQKLKKNNIITALLDSEILLSKAINKSREFIILNSNDDINEKELKNLEKRDDGKFEVLDVKLDNRKTKSLNPNEKNGLKDKKIEIIPSKIDNISESKENIITNLITEFFYFESYKCRRGHFQCCKYSKSQWS